MKAFIAAVSRHLSGVVTDATGIELTAPDDTPKWRRPECQAAVVNGALMLFGPYVVAVYGDYTWTAVRPAPPTVLSSAVRGLPLLVGLAPLSLVTMWRTYINGRAYRLKPSTVLSAAPWWVWSSALCSQPWRCW